MSEAEDKNSPKRVSVVRNQVVQGDIYGVNQINQIESNYEQGNTVSTQGMQPSDCSQFSERGNQGVFSRNPGQKTTKRLISIVVAIATVGGTFLATSTEFLSNILSLTDRVQPKSQEVHLPE